MAEQGSSSGTIYAREGLIDPDLVAEVSGERVVREAAASIAVARPGVTVYGCTTGSYMKGLAGVSHVADQLSEGLREPRCRAPAVQDLAGAGETRHRIRRAKAASSPYPTIHLFSPVRQGMSVTGKPRQAFSLCITCDTVRVDG